MEDEPETSADILAAVIERKEVRIDREIKRV